MKGNLAPIAILIIVALCFMVASCIESPKPVPKTEHETLNFDEWMEGIKEENSKSAREG